VKIRPVMLRRRRPDVFISYASRTRQWPMSSSRRWSCKAYRVDRPPRESHRATHYASEIVHGQSILLGAIVLVLSANSSSSPHVLREVERATSNANPVVSLRIDQTSLPAEFQYFLNTSQWLDASEGGTGPAYAKLVARCARLFSRRSTGPSPPGLLAGRCRSGATLERASTRQSSWWPSPAWQIVGLQLPGLGEAHIQQLSLRHRLSLCRDLTPAPAVPAIFGKIRAGSAVRGYEREEGSGNYFSDGLSEELIDMLTKIPELQVPARTSSFYFKGKQQP